MFSRNLFKNNGEQIRFALSFWVCDNLLHVPMPCHIRTQELMHSKSFFRAPCCVSLFIFVCPFSISRKYIYDHDFFLLFLSFSSWCPISKHSELLYLYFTCSCLLSNILEGLEISLLFFLLPSSICLTLLDRQFGSVTPLYPPLTVVGNRAPVGRSWPRMAPWVMALDYGCRVPGCWRAVSWLLLGTPSRPLGR